MPKLNACALLQSAARTAAARMRETGNARGAERLLRRYEGDGLSGTCREIGGTEATRQAVAQACAKAGSYLTPAERAKLRAEWNAVMTAAVRMLPAPEKEVWRFLRPGPEPGRPKELARAWATFGSLARNVGLRSPLEIIRTVKTRRKLQECGRVCYADEEDGRALMRIRYALRNHFGMPFETDEIAEICATDPRTVEAYCRSDDTIAALDGSKVWWRRPAAKKTPRTTSVLLRTACMMLWAYRRMPVQELLEAAAIRGRTRSRRREAWREAPAAGEDAPETTLKLLETAGGISVVRPGGSRKAKDVLIVRERTKKETENGDRPGRPGRAELLILRALAASGTEIALAADGRAAARAAGVPESVIDRTLYESSFWKRTARKSRTLRMRGRPSDYDPPKEG